MDKLNEITLEEKESLADIYGTEFATRSQREWQVSLGAGHGVRQQQGTLQANISVIFTIPENYPEDCLKAEVVGNKSYELHLIALTEQANSFCQEHKGEPQVFVVTEALREVVAQLTSQSRNNSEPNREPTQAEKNLEVPLTACIEPATFQLARCHSTSKVGFEVFMAKLEASIHEGLSKMKYDMKRIKLTPIAEPQHFIKLYQDREKNLTNETYSPYIILHTQHWCSQYFIQSEDTGVQFLSVSGSGVISVNVINVGKLKHLNSAIDTDVQIDGMTLKTYPKKKKIFGQPEKTFGWTLDVDTGKWKCETSSESITEPKEEIFDTIIMDNDVILAENTNIFPAFSVTLLPFRKKRHYDSSFLDSISSSNISFTSLNQDWHVLHIPPMQFSDAKRVNHVLVLTSTAINILKDANVVIQKSFADYVEQLKATGTVWLVREARSHGKSKVTWDKLTDANSVADMMKKTTEPTSSSDETFRNEAGSLAMSPLSEIFAAVMARLFGSWNVSGDDTGCDSASTITMLAAHEDIKSQEVQEITKSYDRLADVTVAMKMILANTPTDDVNLALTSFKARFSDASCDDQCFIHDMESGCSDITEVLGGCASEIDEWISRFNKRMPLDVIFDSGRAGEGFVEDLSEIPTWATSISRAKLYYGTPPKSMMLCGVVQTLKQVENFDPTCVSSAVLPLLSKLRNFVGTNSLRSRRHLSQGFTLAKNTHELTETWIKKFLKKDRPSQFEIEMFKSARKLAMRLRTIISDVAMVNSVRLEGKWYRRLQEMKFGKRIVKRSATTEIDKDEVSKELEEELRDFLVTGTMTSASAEPLFRLEDIGDALMMTRSDGLGIRLLRTEASKIEPWLIIPLFVTPSVLQFRHLYTLHEYGVQPPVGDKTEDEKAEILKCTDILPLVYLIGKQQTDKGGGDRGESKMPLLAQMVYSYTFTRHYSLYLPDQPRALLVLSWVNVIESMFRMCLRSGGQNKEAKVHKLTGLTHMLTAAVQALTKEWRYAKCLVDNLIKLASNPSEGDLAHLLSEAGGTMSVCMALAALLSPSAKQLFDAKAADTLKLFSIGTLTEALMRACRVRLRGSKNDAAWFIRRALGYSGLHQLKLEDVNMQESTITTGSLFRNRKITNCSAYTVVSVLGFLEHYHQGRSCEEIAKLFIDQKIKMGTFLKRNLGEGCNGRQAQLAFYLEGMKYNKSKTRPKIKAINPEAVIIEHLKEQNELIESRLRALKALRQRSKLRNASRIERALLQAKNHETPMLFTKDVIDKLNAERSKEDQLELTHSGLLRYHCCYPKCPKFLNRFSSRQKLFKHLQPDMVTGNYTRGFHLVCKDVFNKNQDFGKFASCASDAINVREQNEDRRVAPDDAELYFVWASLRLYHGLDINTKVKEENLIQRNKDLISDEMPKLLDSIVQQNKEETTRVAAIVTTCDNSDELVAYLQSLSRESTEYILFEEMLLTLGPKDIPLYEEKLWMCATGCRHPKIQTVTVLDGIPSPKAQVFAGYISRFRNALREYVYNFRLKIRNHQYRNSELPNRLGHFKDNPSYWALGFKDWNDFTFWATEEQVANYLEAHKGKKSS
eukprot:m.151993 g.151993  ORF g.151993 m.151993 type:complete len:1575 (+) comp15048_c1_seq7:233-4957(+)